MSNQMMSAKKQKDATGRKSLKIVLVFIKYSKQGLFLS